MCGCKQDAGFDAAAGRTAHCHTGVVLVTAGPFGVGRATRVLALLRDGDYVLPQDLQDIAPYIRRHRLVFG